MADPLVNTFHSRDLDSRPSDREIAAVDEFLDSNLDVHIMKDHKEHRAPILGERAMCHQIASVYKNEAFTRSWFMGPQNAVILKAEEIQKAVWRTSESEQGQEKCGKIKGTGL